jgi:predicted Zn finger-like uncharacterized protein
VNISCPKCGTVYSVDQEALEACQGLVQCHQCDNVFNALAHQTDEDALQPTPAGPNAIETINPDLELNLETEELPDFSDELPFEVPEDLPVLEPASEAALDANHTLEPGERKPPPGWQKLLLLALSCTLLLQLAWMTRAAWLKLPQAQPLCEWVDCSIAQQRDPQAFTVIERQLQADPILPQALRLQVRFGNQADFAQPLPRLQLSLFDSSGNVLARRLFSAEQYLFPAPQEGTLAQPQEVFTIELLLEDPGTLASGFKIDFL